MGNLGATEIIIIVLVVLLFFGAKKIPELMQGLGKDVEKGELPDEPELLGQMVENICYKNARDYFGF